MRTLDLDDVTLVHSHRGGGPFLTARGRDTRVARQAILPGEAFPSEVVAFPALRIP